MGLHRLNAWIPGKERAAAVFVILMALLLVAMVLPLAAVAGSECPAQNDPPAETGAEKVGDALEGGSIEVESALELSNPISPEDFQVIATWGDSYLAENSAGKRLLYLAGDAYQRGYAEGYLCPQSVERVAKDYLENVFFELLEDMGIALDLRQFPWLWNLLWNLLKIMVAANQDAIPEEFLTEMRGISDACRDLGYDVGYRDLLTLNAGMDTLESIYVGFGAIFCNEFAVFGDATDDGRLFHGRDFMFPTGGDIFSDEAMIIVHNPTQGYPFVTSAAPAFVGIPTGMNTEGVSCAMDVVYSIFTRPLISGEGTLLLCRKVTQFAGSLDEGIAMIRDSDRAVPWLYLISDGEQHGAAVLETFASSLLPPGHYLQKYLARLFFGLLGLLCPCLNQGYNAAFPAGADGAGEWEIVDGEVVGNSLVEPEEHPSCTSLEKGVMVRWPDYVDPEWFDGPGSAVQPDGGPGLACGFFPRQNEEYPDLVAMTNHYIIPLMSLTYPSLPGSSSSSPWRYDTMLTLLDEHYGEIDATSAMWIIDFLNPARCDYYGTDTSQSIKGHHVLMDNQDLEMWSLHGYYDTSWVHVDLMEVLADSQGG
ncbi:MAG: hypothetical protein C4536_00390 [Actinobacteria bacterium]|jgi:hypothetical protein|nr:MAG: hypothetical protein C4536_00390 [Actinomycetota bacterium]